MGYRTYGFPTCRLIRAARGVPAGMPDEGAWAEGGEGLGAGVDVLGREGGQLERGGRRGGEGGS